MSRLLCLALMLFGLGACGDGFTLPAPSSAVSSCGEILLTGTPLRASDSNAAQQAMRCFVQAYQGCAASSLMVREANTNATRQFSIQPKGSSCTLREAFQSDANSPPAVADCKTARFEQNTLVIESCSHLGDFTLTP